MNKCIMCLRELDKHGTCYVCSSVEKQSEQIKKDYEFTEVEVQKLNLKPGDTLMVTIKNSYVEAEAIQLLSNQFRKTFPNNKVFVFQVDVDGEIKFAVVSQPEIKLETPVNLGYCTNCDCGKKEAAEGNKNEKS